MSIQLLDTLSAESVYMPTRAQILEILDLTEKESLFTIALPDGFTLNHKPGQFMQVSLFGIGEAPISISSSPSRSNGIFEICVRRVGDLTNALHQLEPGDTIGVRGPFGHGFPIRRFYGKDILFAPGGLGLAPLRSLINQVLDERNKFGKVTILYGAKNPGELLFTDELQIWEDRKDVDLHVTVDNPDEQWTGNSGVITTLFPKIQVYAPNTIAITCGPPVMYRFVLMELIGLGIRDGNIWLSLERRMKCGMGKCGHCQINNFYACKDGPCFSYAQIKHKDEAL
ncbi:MAG: FAD/NAD(P)-binding protein [Anaerolineales bacterium]|jgi:sulfhydrogenase subunit gamma (sulfur reductase)